jgi:hypothetical protein
MSETHLLPRGHVILVVTPTPGAQPTYRAYVVAEDDPLKARALVARFIRADEMAYVLAAFPAALQQIPGLEPGGVLRL